MSAPIFYGPNRLRTSVVTSATTVDGFPIGRLWDGFTGPLWKGTGPIDIDQGSGYLDLPVDAVIILAGHNLGGATVTVVTDSSNTFASPTTLGSAASVSADVAFVIEFTGTVEQYLRISFSGAPSPLEIGELFLAPALEAPMPPTLESSPNRTPNFTDQETEAGVVLTTIRGRNRWTAEWTILRFPRSLRTDFLEFYDDIDGGGQACVVVDDEDEIRFTQARNISFSGGDLPQYYEGHFSLRELLG